MVGEKERAEGGGCLSTARLSSLRTSAGVVERAVLEACRARGLVTTTVTAKKTGAGAGADADAGEKVAGFAFREAASRCAHRIDVKLLQDGGSDDDGGRNGGGSGAASRSIMFVPSPADGGAAGSSSSSAKGGGKGGFGGVGAAAAAPEQLRAGAIPGRGGERRVVACGAAAAGPGLRARLRRIILGQPGAKDSPGM